jgi:sirohydrochlorin ferrochelatase
MGVFENTLVAEEALSAKIARLEMEDQQAVVILPYFIARRPAGGGQGTTNT